jgi:hypothetical protein
MKTSKTVLSDAIFYCMQSEKLWDHNDQKFKVCVDVLQLPCLIDGVTVSGQSIVDYASDMKELYAEGSYSPSEFHDMFISVENFLEIQ